MDQIESFIEINWKLYAVTEAESGKQREKELQTDRNLSR